MATPQDKMWRIRLNKVKEALEGNNFEAHVAENKTDAARIVLDDIMGRVDRGSASWGGSATFKDLGLYDALKKDPNLSVIDTYDKSGGSEDVLEKRRQALLVDVFFTGTNAVTEDGNLVNLDMYGNRVAALTFGPRNVVVVAGRNKIVEDLEDAMRRVKYIAAPVNTQRLGKKTPCVKTGFCEDCKSPDRICNTWVISEKSYPKGRVKVVLVNEDLGY